LRGIAAEVDAMNQRSGQVASPPPADGAPAIREIGRLEEFDSIRGEWDALVRASRRPTLYLTHAWLSTWWECHQSRERQLLLVLVYDGARLIGGAPFMKSSGRLLGLPVAKIELLTMMPVAASPSNCSGELDFIFVAGREDVVGAIFRHLAEHHRWHFIRLYPLPESSPTLKLLQGVAEATGTVLHQKEAFANACLHLEHGWDEHAKTVSKQFRRTIRQHEQKLLKLGTVRFVEYRTPFEVEVMFNDVLEIEKASWKWGKGVAINSVAFRGFFRRLAISAAGLGWMRLWMVELDGRNIAYDFCVAYDGKVQSLKKSYRTAYREYFPGGVLESHCFAAMAGEGAREINLLSGDEEYKRKWSPVLERHVEVMLFNGTAYSRLIGRLFFTSRLEHWRERLNMLAKRVLRRLGARPAWSELTRDDQLRHGEGEGGTRPAGALRPGTAVRVKETREILRTLDGSGALAGITFLPEMLGFSGKVFRVAQVAPSASAGRGGDPAGGDAILLQGAICDGTEHRECAKACDLLWREEWLEPAAEPPSGGTGPAPARGAGDLATCQLGPDTAYGRPGFIGLPRLLRLATSRGEGRADLQARQE
jgi:CelD/BcsL family acetyltransferase involved in cellulose biosynthesis